MKLGTISSEELSRHSTKEDCWVAIHGTVYNLTDVLKWHPEGEEVILDHAGKDGTIGFDDAHHPKAYLENFDPIGSFEEEIAVTHEDL